MDLFSPYSIFSEVGILTIVGLFYFVAMKHVRRELMDSPWLWGMLFSGVALVGLIVVGPKYEKREASVELKYIGRERAVPSASPEVNGGNVPTAEELQKMAQPTVPPLDAPAGLIVPLWYLAGIVGTVFAASTIMLYRQIVCTKPL